jgi:hypothetical protein
MGKDLRTQNLRENWMGTMRLNLILMRMDLVKTMVKKKVKKKVKMKVKMKLN